MANGNRSTSSAGAATLLTLVVVVAALYFARAVFIPLALAVLLAFLLAPLVLRLRHWGLLRENENARLCDSPDDLHRARGKRNPRPMQKHQAPTLEGRCPRAGRMFVV